jgi:Carboxypeptidase regulatory-like domain/TonB dependent receptor/TonB-dependent Receptor Plug Domain
MKRFFLLVSIAVCLLLAALLPAPAQAQTASVGGVIRDPSEQMVTGAKITLLNTETSISRDASSNDEGIFWFTNVAPGPYSITVERDGFKAIHINELTLTVNQSFTFEAHLELGPVATTMEVKASELPLIDLDNAQISNLVDSKRIQELPLLTRDPYQLVLLSPGVIQSNSPGLSGFSVNGGSERNNNFLLDGVDNNDTEVPGAPKGLNALNPDSTQEFRVITSNFAPEYGRNDGSIIQVITRSGTNDYHGDAYWFGRYNALGARDFFNPASTGPQNPYVRNDFGASVGGPMIKDKAFWFLNYEGQRFVTTLTNASVVPTAALKTGKFTAPDPVTGAPDRIDVSTPKSPDNALGYPLDPTMQKILALFPNPNGPPVVPGISGTLFYPSTSHLQSDSFTVKVDYNLSKRNTASVRYSFNQQSDPNFEHSDFLPGNLGATSLYVRNQNASIGLTSTLTDRLINEFRFGANRSHQNYGCDGYQTFDSFGQIDPVGIGADYGIPFGSPSDPGFGCLTLFESDGQARYTGTYQTLDSMSFSRGRHLFKWGGEFRAVYSNSYDNFSTRTYLDFQGFTSSGGTVTALYPTSPLYNDPTTENAVLTLLGVVNSQYQTQYFDKQQNRASSDLRGFRQREWEGFVQDTWRLLPNLTATYGLRYAYYGVPFEVNNNLSNLFADPSGSAPFTFTIVGPGTGHTLYKNQYDNFEPRFGLAWDPLKKGRTSVRAGYGIFHDRIYGNLFGNSRGNPPFSLSPTIPQNVPLSQVMPPVTINQPDPLVVPDESYYYVYLIDPNLKTPYSQNWNFGVQQALTPTITLEVNYVGVKGTHLFRTVDGNPPQPNRVAYLLGYCVPGNAFDCDASTLQFGPLYYGGDFDNLPINAVNNTAFYSGGGPGAFVYKSIGTSIYNGMQVNLQKQFTHGLQFQVAYTFSHAIDNINDPLQPAVGNGNLPRNSFDLQAERGNSDFDIRHRAVINFIYEPNIGRGRGHLSEGFVGRILEGWALSGIIAAQTGHPYDIYGTTDSNHTGEAARVTLTGSPSQPPGTDKTFTGPYIGSISNTPFGVQPNTGKNEFYGPGLVNIDVATVKDTVLTEKLKLEFRLEAYNLFNHTQFAQPNNAYAPGNETFGQSLSTLTRPDGTTSARQLQVALKLLF